VSDELESECITNQDTYLDFRELASYINELIDLQPGLWGGVKPMHDFAKLKGCEIFFPNRQMLST
jgi:hypothetical protein